MQQDIFLLMHGDQTDFFLQNCGYVVQDIPTELPSSGLHFIAIIHISRHNVPQLLSVGLLACQVFCSWESTPDPGLYRLKKNVNKHQ